MTICRKSTYFTKKTQTSNNKYTGNYINGMDRGIFPHRRVNMNPVTEMKRNWQKIIILADPGQSLFTKTKQHSASKPYCYTTLLVNFLL